MKDFFVWLVAKSHKLFGMIVEIVDIVSEIKINHTLIQANQESYIDTEIELSVQKHLLRNYIILKIGIYLIATFVAIPIATAITESAAMTGVAVVFIYYEASRISKTIACELCEVTQ